MESAAAVACSACGSRQTIRVVIPEVSALDQLAYSKLMIAQDTGSAIVGPARADLYFGAGAEAGRVSGRLRHNARFVMLLPKSLDPVERGRKLPLPDPRPSEKIAKLFPQVDPLKDKKDAAAVKESAKGATPVAQATPAQAPAVKPVPLPEARPTAAPAREMRRRIRHRQR